MASQGYRDWIAAGRPYTLVRPARAIVAALQGYGLTVWHYPNEEHQKANTPEDHTPYSVTGYPGTNARWYARGVDVMPRSGSYAHRKENADIARQLIRDRDAGVPGVAWIKYLNWTTEDGQCLQERWTTPGQPNRRTTRGSTDRGHIHISGRSDIDNDDRADEYDPIARMHGLQPEGEADDMGNTWTFVEQAPDEAWRLTQGAEGYAGHARDTALAFAWQAAAEARENTERLIAAAAADETRDATTQAAIAALAEAIKGREGVSFDTAQVLQAIEDAATASRRYVEQLQADLRASVAREAELRARLAEAFRPGSE